MGLGIRVMKTPEVTIDSHERNCRQSRLFAGIRALLLASTLTSCAGIKPVEPPLVWSAAVVKDGVSCQAAMVPVRDGTRLYTEVYRSVDTADSSAQLPVMLTRSPYARAFGEGCFSRAGLQDIARKGYVGVYQSARGTGSSEGVFRTVFQEKDDGADLIAWAAKQSWSNGRIGMTGGSYLGATQWQPALASPPNLVAIAPYITPIDYRDNWFGVNGVFDPFIRNWAQQFIAEHVIHKLRREGASQQQIDAALKAQGATMPPGMPTGKPSFSAPISTPPTELAREALAFQWEAYRHPEYDAYWAQIDGLKHIGRIKVPALVDGGWYDIFEKGTIDSYIAMKKGAGTPAARRGTMLVMDCCGHGLGAPPQPGMVSWGENKAVYNNYRDRFMEHYLKGVDNGIDREPPVQISVLLPPDAGTKGDTFVYKAADFPVPGTRYLRYHLSSAGQANTRDGDGVLDTTHGSSGAPDSFAYDPNDPVPSRGGTHGGTIGAMDQAEVVRRPDVLVYTAVPTATDLAIIGKVSVSFWATTDGKDTDFTAILVDVHPDGLSHVIVERIVRGRFRKGRNLPAQLLKPNMPYQYDLELGYTATMLKPRHRLQLLISSSSYPGYERNLNTGASNEDTTETRAARNTVLHDAAHPSFVTIPVVDGVSPP
jgi:uncharacterized protein